MIIVVIIGDYIMLERFLKEKDRGLGLSFLGSF
jgi:hypothetical protein